MQFQSSHDAEERLKNPAQLKPEEIDALFEWMHQISETGMRRLNAHLALKNLQAVQKFEQSSSNLTKWLIWLTAVLVILTIVIACYTVVLARKESSGAKTQLTSQVSTNKILGPWKAKFTIPGSATLPEQSPTVKCSFSKPPDAGAGFIGISIANLSDESYIVRYNIYGYDQSGRRISQGSDEFAIGKRETVLRHVFLNSDESMFGKLGSVFWIQMILED